MDPLIGSLSPPEHPGSNALITIGIITAGIIKRVKKNTIQKSIQDTFCSGSENEVEGGGKAGVGGLVGKDGGRDGGREVRGWGGDV